METIHSIYWHAFIANVLIDAGYRTNVASYSLVHFVGLIIAIDLAGLREHFILEKLSGTAAEKA